MFRHFRKAVALLGARERTRVYVIVVTSAAAAAVQTVSILSIMPFIMLLANPELLHTAAPLVRLNELIAADSYYDFLVVFGLLAILVLTIGNLFIALEQWVSHRFLCRLRHGMEKQVLQGILSKRYEFFVANHSAKLSNVVLSEVERVVEGVIGTFASIFGSLALALCIVLMLLVISFQTTIVTLLGLLLAYLLLFLTLRRRVEGHGEELTRLNASVFTAVKEAFDGIREIKTRRAESFFGRRFASASLERAGLEVRYGILTYLPHFLLETIVFAGFVVVALYFVVATGDSGVSLSFIALYGMAVYRLIPALQGIFEGMANLHHNADAVYVLSQHVEDRTSAVPRRPSPTPRSAIVLDRVSYRFPGERHHQLEDIDFTLPVGSSLCLFGASGAGKTTLLNLLAGLIHPTEGRVLCDGVAIVPENVESWREKLGYAPQQVYLFADTLASNVAFGHPIDAERIDEVSRIANLHRFVTGKLPRGYASPVGERGETLSGGQRQRVGIARSLYHDPPLLIFDESFSSLDAENRSVILDNLFALPGKTLVFASHEAGIALRCDKTVVLDHGRVTAEGRFEELLDRSAQVAELAALADAKTG